jgi:hypothetical protein
MDHEAEFSEPQAFPAELCGPTPRKVRLTGAGWYDVCLGSVFVAIAAALLVLFYSKAIHDVTIKNDLRQSTSETMGQITGKWGTPKPRIYGINYTFFVDGVTYAGKSSAPEDIWRGLGNGDNLSIKYFPSDPNINHPAGWEITPGSMWWRLIFGVIALPGFGVYRRLLKKRRFAIEGVPAIARITNCYSDGRGYRLEYEFRTENGDLMACSGNGSKREIGSTVCLLYLPANPSRHGIYPIDAFRIETGNSE